MAREPEHLVALRQALGEELRATREAANLTQRQLAKAAFCDCSNVSHIEAGRVRGSEQFWQAVDKRCGADGALVAAYKQYEAAKRDHEVGTKEAELAAARVKVAQLRAQRASQEAAFTSPAAVPELSETDATQHNQLTASDDCTVLLAASLALCAALTSGIPSQKDITHDQLIILHRLVALMKRRGLLQLLGLTATSAVTSPMLGSLQALAGLNPDEQARLAGAVTAPKRVDEQVIRHIEEVLLTARSNNRRLGPQAAFYTVLGQSHLLQVMLQECPDNDKLRTRLLSVLSNALRIAGRLSFDTNDFLGAQYYFEQARAAAHEAQDTRSNADILGNMSQLAVWTDKPHVGLDHAMAAQAWATKTGSVALQAFASDVTAEAAATAGDYDHCMQELNHAEIYVASLSEQPSSPHYYYNTAIHTARRGKCLLRLGRTDAAIEVINQSLALDDVSSVRGVALTKLDLGKAHIQSKEIDEAARAIGEVASLATQYRSTRLMTGLHTAREAMQPWEDMKAVRELDEQLISYGLAPNAGV